MSVSLAEALLLGAVQGLTEWLPVSSSGHLIIVANLTGGDEAPALFDISLHLGTLLVVLAFFRHEVLELARAAWRGLGALRQGHSLGQLMDRDPPLSMFMAVLVGTLPTALLGLIAALWLEDTLRSLPSVGVALMVTGGLLVSIRSLPSKREGDQVRLKDGLLVGLVQGLAVVPGISRSGSTISVGLHRGLEGDTAARLSFLLFIPAILGAATLSFLQAFRGEGLASDVSYLTLVAGTLTAMVVGAATLKLLLVVVHRHVLHYFAPYCLVVGATVLVWGLTG